MFAMPLKGISLAVPILQTYSRLSLEYGWSGARVWLEYSYTFLPTILLTTPVYDWIIHTTFVETFGW